ncbi:MAG: hypoxanthine phosphoribosyltransferase [Dehalococcoidales bacterium]|nr:hypoxanthine phosphoribosyltransferase [Dehalococcoidales bacterium]
MREARPISDSVTAFTFSNDIGDVLIDRDRLQERVRELGAAISQDYDGRVPLLVGVLRGTILFFADLLRAINVHVEIDYIAISSYGPSTHSSGVVRVLKDLDESIEGRDVILVEDIVDTGLTLRYILRNLRNRRPASLAICALLDKQVRRLVDIDIKYKGFEIPDAFVVGYGLDYRQRYRNLPFICILKPEVYQS